MLMGMDIVSIVMWYISVGNSFMDWYVANTRLILDVVHVFFQSSFSILLVLTAVLSGIFLVISFVSLFYRPHRYPTELSSYPTVTIQIPTRNELAALNCAQRCLAFDYPTHKVSIIIGDDSNDPEVSKAIDTFVKNNKRIEVMRRKHNVGYKPGNLINMLKKTTGEIIVIFDSDFLPEKDFLKKIVAPFLDDPTVAAVQSRWVPMNAKDGFTAVLGTGITEMFHQVFLPFMQMISGSVCLCGSAEAVRRSTLLKQGGWKSGSFTEDIEYSFRLYKAGHKVVYLPTLTCAMEVPHHPIDLYKQQMRWAYGVIQATKQHLWDILRAPVHWGLKTNTLLIVSGYVFTLLIVMLTITGFLAFFTHPPGPINISLFVVDTSFNILLTVGLLGTYLVAMVRAHRIRHISHLIVSSFTIGFVVVYYVNKGIFKSICNHPMQWFILRKQGNTQVAS